MYVIVNLPWGLISVFVLGDASWQYHDITRFAAQGHDGLIKPCLESVEPVEILFVIVVCDTLTNVPEISNQLHHPCEHAQRRQEIRIPPILGRRLHIGLKTNSIVIIGSELIIFVVVIMAQRPEWRLSKGQ